MQLILRGYRKTKKKNNSVLGLSISTRQHPVHWNIIHLDKFSWVFFSQSGIWSF